MNPDPSILWLLRHPLVLMLIFWLGACVGSFLNVVIYRVPLGMRVDQPSRSFCPTCKYQIPFYLNIPILSWFILRGRCASCGEPFSIRYAMVELLTALLFLSVWWTFCPSGWVIALIYCVLVALMVAATFIDIDHQIIPFCINLGGLGFALLVAPLVPQLFGASTWWQGLMWSGIGAIAGFGIIWLVIQFGKLAFGRATHRFEEPAPWKVHQPDEEQPPIVILGDETYDFYDIFNRESDKLRIQCSSLKIDGEARKVDELVLYFNRLVIGDDTIPIDQVKVLEGTTTHAVRSREAMGMGDAYFLGMVGAFLGWQATLFALMAGSLLGSVIGIVQKVAAREKFSQPLPFGPYLALGAMIFMFWGSDILDWYLVRIRG